MQDGDDSTLEAGEVLKGIDSTTSRMRVLAQSGRAESPGQRERDQRARRRRRRCLLLGLALLALIFAFDMTQPLGVAAESAYCTVLGLAVLAQSRRQVVGFGLAAAALTIAGWWLSPAAEGMALVDATNRLLALSTLLLVAAAASLQLDERQDDDLRWQARAEIDALTRVSTRRVITWQLDQLVSSGKPVAALLVDVDHFKQINDNHGHLRGDVVLRLIASALTRCMRRGDLLGRYGGEEFLVVCPGASLEAGVALGERLRREIAGLELGAEGPPSISISVGVAASGASADEPQTPAELLHAADQALYTAKDSGRDRVVAHNPKLRL